MIKKIFIIILILAICIPLSYFLLRHFYLETVKRDLTIKYYSPSSEVLAYNPTGKVAFSFKYPVPKDYFLKNFEVFPDINGEFIFKEGIRSPISVMGYKEIEFLPKEIERDKFYQIKVFEKEFNFSLPSPKVQKMEFNPERKEIEIVFFDPVDESYFLKNFKIEPTLKGKYYFLEGNKKIIFRPEIIEEDKDYNAKISDKNISFKIESPKVKDFVFNDQLKQIEITFTKPISRELFLQGFSTSTPLEGDYIFDDVNAKVIFKIRNIIEDQNYGVRVLGKDFSFKSESVKVKKIYFDNSKKQVVIIFTKPIESSKFFENFKINPSLEGKFTFNSTNTQAVFKPNEIKEGQEYEINILGSNLFFKYTPPPQAVPPPAINGEKYIDISLSDQRLRLYQGGVAIADYLISSGRSGMVTPTGSFSVLSKELNHWSSQYSLYMPYAIKFYNGFYIHELPYWPGGYREGENHLGIPVSHGCVRLGIGPAAAVFNFADIGTKVIIHN
jgi:lipoprotein-anchoring transpeptidase ErfK/SrfK